MEKGSNIFRAILLVVLGMVVHGSTFDISSYSVPWGVFPVALFHGPALEPNIFNFLLAKITLFFLLWGVITVFSRLGKPTAGFLSALLIAVYPAASLNSGYLTPFLFVLAVFWWSLSRVTTYGTSRDFLPAIMIAFFGIFFITSWMALLAVLPFALRPQEGGEDKRVWQRILLLIAGLCLLAAVFLLAPFTERLEDLVLLHDNLLWLRRFLNMAMTFNLIYSWGASVFICIGFAAAFRNCPRSLVYFAVVLACILAFASLDMGGILVIWVYFSTLAALAVEGVVGRLRDSGKIWLANILLTGCIFCLFAISADGRLSKIMQAKSYYKSTFHHKCGDVAAHPASVTGKVVKAAREKKNETGCLLAWGNYHHLLPGRYRATFYLCQQGGEGSYVDVTQGYGAALLTRKKVLADSIDCSRNLEPLEVKYTVKDNLSSPVEHRVFYDNSGVLYFDHVEIELVK